MSLARDRPHRDNEEAQQSPEFAAAVAQLNSLSTQPDSKASPIATFCRAYELHVQQHGLLPLGRMEQHLHGDVRKFLETVMLQHLSSPALKAVRGLVQTPDGRNRKDPRLAWSLSYLDLLGVCGGVGNGYLSANVAKNLSIAQRDGWRAEDLLPALCQTAERRRHDALEARRKHRNEQRKPPPRIRPEDVPNAVQDLRNAGVRALNVEDDGREGENALGGGENTSGDGDNSKDGENASEHDVNTSRDGEKHAHGQETGRAKDNAPRQNSPGGDETFGKDARQSLDSMYDEEDGQVEPGTDGEQHGQSEGHVLGKEGRHYEHILSAEAAKAWSFGGDDEPSLLVSNYSYSDDGSGDEGQREAQEEEEEEEVEEGEKEADEGEESVEISRRAPLSRKRSLSSVIDFSPLHGRRKAMRFDFSSPTPANTSATRLRITEHSAQDEFNVQDTTVSMKFAFQPTPQHHTSMPRPQMIKKDAAKNVEVIMKGTPKNIDKSIGKEAVEDAIKDASVFTSVPNSRSHTHTVPALPDITRAAAWRTLHPKQWLSGTAIDELCRLLLPPGIHIVPYETMTTPPARYRALAQMSLATLPQVVLIMNHGPRPGLHWTAALLDPSRRLCSIVDSLPSKKYHVATNEKVKTFLKLLPHDDDSQDSSQTGAGQWSLLRPADAPRQSDDYNCGLLCVLDLILRVHGLSRCSVAIDDVVLRDILSRALALAFPDEINVDEGPTLTDLDPPSMKFAPPNSGPLIQPMLQADGDVLTLPDALRIREQAVQLQKEMDNSIRSHEQALERFLTRAYRRKELCQVLETALSRTRLTYQKELAGVEKIESATQQILQALCTDGDPGATTSSLPLVVTEICGPVYREMLQKKAELLKDVRNTWASREHALGQVLQHIHLLDEKLKAGLAQAEQELASRE